MASRLATRLSALLLALLAGAAAASPAQRLGEAVRIPTISYQDRELIDYSQFAHFNQFLRDNYPRVFDALEVETVNGFSLLLRWPGSDPALAPVLFTAHTDVVPVEPGTEGDWQHPPFAGVVADGPLRDVDEAMAYGFPVWARSLTSRTARGPRASPA